MRLILLKILLILITIFSYSCEDVIKSDINYIKEKRVDSTDILNIEYRFFMDNIALIPGDSSLEFNSRIPSSWTKIFTILYKGKSDSLIVNNISLESGKYFEIKFLYGDKINFVLKPNKVNDFFNPIIYLNTENLLPGIYTDRIYINNKKETGILIKVNIE